MKLSYELGYAYNFLKPWLLLFSILTLIHFTWVAFHG